MNLKQLAQQLGLSQTTVSRALNGYPEVSERTRRRVQEAAAEFSYTPSRHAQLLATGRSRAIGHVVPLTRHSVMTPYFSDFIAGAGEVYAQYGFDMLISVVPEAEEENHYRTMAASNRVEGLIVHGPKTNESRIGLLKALDIPFLVHGRADNPSDGYLWMDIDNKRSFERVTNFLTDLGHRRIALLNGVEEWNFASRRRTGYIEALHQNNIEIDPTIMFSDDMIEPHGYSRTCQLLEMDERPTAIITSSVLLAMGVLRALNEFGLRAGKEISIVAHDDQLSFLHRPGDVPFFTSTRSSINKAGRRCAELLIDYVKSPGNPPESELWETELVVGSSTGPAPG
ncbi:MAG: LacI family DNA-binding transcriptional regulator [Rhizobiaceae bacterium]